MIPERDESLIWYIFLAALLVGIRAVVGTGAFAMRRFIVTIGLVFYGVFSILLFVITGLMVWSCVWGEIPIWIPLCFGVVALGNIWVWKVIRI